MADPTIDEISPSYVREKRIQVVLGALDPPKPVIPEGASPEEVAAITAAYQQALNDVASTRLPPKALNQVMVSVDYSRALPEGVMLPLVLEVQGPSKQSYQRREYTRTAPPSAIIFTLREGGPHLVTLREVAHNLWFGNLHLDIKGELLEQPKVA